VNVTLPAGWILVNDNRGGVHHYRRVLADTTLLSVWERPAGGWVWGHFVGATGAKLAGTAGTRLGVVHTSAEYAMSTADEYYAGRPAHA